MFSSSVFTNTTGSSLVAVLVLIANRGIAPSLTFLYVLKVEPEVSMEVMIGF